MISLVKLLARTICFIPIPALPTLLQDMIHKADKWGNDGKINPFTDVFDVSISIETHDPVLSPPFQLVFLMTARLVTCEDLAKNEADLKKISGLLDAFITSPTPFASMLPWFPGPARVKMIMSNLRMFSIFRSYVEARRRAVPTNDAIDVLIAEGEKTKDIVIVSSAPNL